MKRADLKRVTPLTREAPLRSGKGLQRKGWGASTVTRSTRQRATPKRRGADLPATVRSALAARSGGLCEVQAPGCDGRAVDPSHRKTTGMGGRKGAAAVAHHVLSNLLHVCRGCHEGAIHARPADAFWRGWMLRQHEDPRAVPCLYRGVWVLLDDQGGCTPTKSTPEEA